MKLDVDFEIFSILAFYSSILLLKLLLMPALVSRVRLSKKVRDKKDSSKDEVFANPEDRAFARGGTEVSIKNTDQDVERVRRAHLNDLENILPFIPLAILYAFTNPGIDCARLLWQSFTVARVVHTICYLVPVARRPWIRFGACIVGWGINVHMGLGVVWANL